MYGYQGGMDGGMNWETRTDIYNTMYKIDNEW